MTGFFVDLIEADLFGIESGGIQSDRASEEGKAQKSLSSWRAGPSGDAKRTGNFGFKTNGKQTFRHVRALFCSIAAGKWPP